MKQAMRGRVAAVLVPLALTLLLAMLPAMTTRAHAGGVTCTFSGPSLTFGTVNPYGGYPYSTSGFITSSCSNSTANPVMVYSCISIGAGTGGTSSSGRTLRSGVSFIAVHITGGSAWPSEIGDGTNYPMAGPFSQAIGAHATPSGSYPLAVTMPNPGSPPTQGSYSSLFNAAISKIYYLVAGTAPTDCSTLSSSSPSNSGDSFSISATVATACTVSATSLMFPTGGVLSAAVTTTATITTTCNASVPVTVALDNGATGTGPTARLMKSGTNAIIYGIYRNAAMTQPWGSASGTDTANVATGTASLTAYGKVPAQTSPMPGSYTDVVNVTISY